MVLKIVQAGHPVLRHIARPLTPEQIVSPAVRDLVERMRDTMRDAPGVGLAAPQVGEPLQIAVIEDPADYHRGIPQAILDERDRRHVEFHVLFNPRLTILAAAPAESPPESPAEFFEGCLSVSGFAAVVPRARRVRVEALDAAARPITIEAEGWYARILQHEIDHLNGTLYVDRMLSRTFTTDDNADRWYAGRPIADTIAVLDAHR